MRSRDDFASTLKRARLAKGLSQAELGALAGLTGSYICILESRRKPPPSEDLVAALARALEVDEPRLQELAALERTPEPVRRRVLRLVRERVRSRRSRDTLLTSSLFHMTRRPGFLADSVSEMLGLPEDRRRLFGRLTERVKALPSADEARAQSGDLLKEVTGKEREALVHALPQLLGGAQALPALEPHAPGAPVAQERPWRRVPLLATVPSPGSLAAASRVAIDSFHVDRRLWCEGAFFLEAGDDDAYPKIEKGDLLLLHPSTHPAEGAWVLVHDGPRVRARRLRREGGDARLESPRADVPPMRRPLARLELVGVIVWIWRPLDGLPPARRRNGSEPGGGRPPDDPA